MDMTQFLEQHAAAAEIVSKIESLIDGGTVKDASEVRSLLSTLVGKLSVHLAVEDKNIYPKAKESDNVALKMMAERLENEMTGLADALMSYSTKWSTASKIDENSAEFISETKSVFDALKKRIEVEETQFYPLVADNL